jgi:hypothetical protein
MAGPSEGRLGERERKGEDDRDRTSDYLPSDDWMNNPHGSTNDTQHSERQK